MNYIQQLPSELLISIFDLVKKNDQIQCGLVNKAFHKQIIPLYWQTFEDSNQDSLCNLITNMKISSSSNNNNSIGQYIRHVNLNELAPDETVLAFLQQVPFLETLHLSRRQPITITDVYCFPQYCPHLTDLFVLISHHHSPGELVVPRSTVQLFTTSLEQHCHQLTHIDLIKCVGLNGGDLFSAISKCPLISVRLLECDFKDMYDPQVVALAASTLTKARGLKSLSIGERRSIDFTPFLTTTMIGKDDPVTDSDTVGVAWPYLTCLSLYPCSTLNDEMAIPFIQSHPSLQELKICRSQITYNTLDAMVMHLPEIIEIVLNGNDHITADGLRHLVKNSASTFHRVKIRGCEFWVSDFPDAYRCMVISDWDENIGYEDFVGDREVVWLFKNAFSKVDNGDDNHNSNDDDDDNDDDDNDNDDGVDGDGLRYCYICEFKHKDL